MNSKAFSMSITTIVVAVLALLILVVLIGVFTGQFGGFTRGVKDCGSKGGTCRTDGCQDDEVKYFGSGLCPEAGGDCCIKLGGYCKEREEGTAPNCANFRSPGQCNLDMDCQWIGG